MLRLRRRHRGYLIVLTVEIAILLLLPLAQAVSWLLSFLMISLCSVLIAYVSRYSTLRRTRPLVYGLGAVAVGMEIIWKWALYFDPATGLWLTLPHVIAWLMFLMLALVRKVKSLVREPYVTTSVVMGAASGYLLVGIAGGVLLNAVSVLSPSTFALPVVPQAAAGLTPDGQVQHAVLGQLANAPALMAASFNLLTTVGSSVANPIDVLGQVSITIITVSGQLYVAILIALILGRFHKRR